MSGFGLALATLFTGVFGAAIGFVVILGTGVLLALPYFLMSRESAPRGADEVIPHKF